jgi:hypothetical protein
MQQTCPRAQHPHDAGIDEEVPQLAQIEGAHLLANAARPFLTECGFTARQILEWADTYIARVGSGDVDSFVEWIHERQSVTTA